MNQQTINQAAKVHANWLWIDPIKNKGQQEFAETSFIAGAEFAIPKWIPVEEALPEVMVDLLFCNNNIRDMDGNPVNTCVNYGWYDRGFFHTYTSPTDNFRATHWMHLPDAPKNVNK